jgi:predicted GIY-YIG superfamily endonuclease
MAWIVLRDWHYSVYVVELDPSVRSERRVRFQNPESDPGKPCVYVGETGTTPEKRFAQHKKGIKAGRKYVMKYGIRLIPELYEHLNPMTETAALAMEKKLAMDLRLKGYTVTGGH